MKILVSACLLGENCKYSGGNNYSEKAAAFVQGHEVIPVCPEVLGGLSVPRTPAEIVNGEVVTKDGVSVDAAFRAGAARALAIAKENGVELAILQPRSPSCGAAEVYDGTFTGRKIPGQGVFAALLRENGLTERHARALLRLQDPEVQRRAAGDMVRRGMNVAQAEAYVEKLLQSDQVTPPRGRSTYIIKDVRLFLNSVDRGLHLMRQAGVDAGWNRQDTDREILLTIRIPKRASGKIDSVSESC